MELEIAIRHAAGIAILDLAGRLIAGPESNQLRHALSQAYDRGSQWMLLNCAGLSSIDSGGVGDLVEACAEIIRRGGMVRLLRPTPKLSHLLELTRLDSLFEIDDDESVALSRFNTLENARAHQKLTQYLAPDV
jgi:anti-sigma B factor antagonist